MKRRSREQLFDEMISAYADWREASRVVNAAYRSWAFGPRFSAGDAFIRYTAALDTEEIAADSYAHLVRRVDRVVTMYHGDHWQPRPARES